MEPRVNTMPVSSLSSALREALARRGEGDVIEDGTDRWRLKAEELLQLADSLFWTLEPYVDRPLVAYLEKGPIYFAFTACCFLHRVSFCPVDISNPIQRVVEIAAQLDGSLILCDSAELLAALRMKTENCIQLSASQSPKSVHIKPPDREKISANYYIATSGSTGVPKLVEVAHDRTIPFVNWAQEFYEIDKTCRWAQFSSIGFDLSLVDFLSALCGGGMLISLSTQIDRLRPAKAICRNAITHWHSVPSIIPYFVKDLAQPDPDSTCRVFSFCGEALIKVDADRLAHAYPSARIINTYGPTETTLFCSFFEYFPNVEFSDELTLPIGQPIPSWNFVLLPDDEFLRLIILSDNIANGYVGHDAGLFSRVSLFGNSMPCFDTGDYFKMRQNRLYFSHRRDGMVKLNGNRIDLGEIEAKASKSGLINPVALVEKSSIVLAVEGDECPVSIIISQLSQLLPVFAVPKRIKFFKSHPRTANGKLDRGSLRKAIAEHYERHR